MQARDIGKGVSVDESGYQFLFDVEKGEGRLIYHLRMHLLGSRFH